MVMVYCYLPFMIMPLYTALEKIDRRLFEASADLGATQWQTFIRVTVPLSMPGIKTGFFLVFVHHLVNLWCRYYWRRQKIICWFTDHSIFLIGSKSIFGCCIYRIQQHCVDYGSRLILLVFYKTNTTQYEVRDYDTHTKYFLNIFAADFLQSAAIYFYIFRL